MSVASCEAEVASCETEVRRIKNEIAVYETLKSKFSTLQTDFTNHQNTRMTNLSAEANCGIENHIRMQYYTGMEIMLTGSDYTKVVEGLTWAGYGIAKKIDDLSIELDLANYYLSLAEDNLEDAIEDAAREAAKAETTTGG